MGLCGSRTHTSVALSVRSTADGYVLSTSPAASYSCRSSYWRAFLGPCFFVLLFLVDFSSIVGFLHFSFVMTAFPVFLVLASCVGDLCIFVSMVRFRQYCLGLSVLRGRHVSRGGVLLSVCGVCFIIGVVRITLSDGSAFYRGPGLPVYEHGPYHY